MSQHNPNTHYDHVPVEDEAPMNDDVVESSPPTAFNNNPNTASILADAATNNEVVQLSSSSSHSTILAPSSLSGVEQIHDEVGPRAPDMAFITDFNDIDDRMDKKKPATVSNIKSSSSVQLLATADLKQIHRDLVDIQPPAPFNAAQLFEDDDDDDDDEKKKPVNDNEESSTSEEERPFATTSSIADIPDGPGNGQLELVSTPPPQQETVSTNNNADESSSPSSSSPPPIQFYEVEAILVREPSSAQVVHSVIPQQPPPQLPVYDAEFIPELPFWKKHARGIIVAISLLFVALTATVIGVMTPMKEQRAEPTTTHSPRPYLWDSCVRYTGALFEADCDGCFPPVGIDGNMTVAAIKRESLLFSSYMDGEFENQFKEIDYTVGGVAISGNVAVIGSPDENNFTGAIHVYEKGDSLLDVWSETEYIVPSDISEGAQFGRYVDIDGDVVVVGSYDYQGSVYVFRRTNNNTWVFDTKLAPNLAMNKDFGGVAKVKGNRIAVGDRLFGFDPEGVVFLYEYDELSKSWNQTSDGILDNADCAGRFGVILALANDHDLMIGCPAQNDWAGAVYHYTQVEDGGEYILQQKLSASDGAPGDRFGGPQQVAVDGDIMTIGEYMNVDGKAFVFMRKGNSNWTEVAIINAPMSESRYFGDRVALSEKKVVIASRENAYSYDLEDCLAKHQSFS